ncbi:hypothetical protein [Streptomyces fractus]|uniref:WXG100-like domain-containing protein n=1 Tax=Streptomyces fractus TaxID=641806 RepID=UPI003CEFCAA5
MAIMLPTEVDWVLDLLDFKWPNIDEDKLHEAAQLWREFGQAAAEYATQGESAARAVAGAHVGEAAEAFVREWKKFDGGDGYLADLATSADLLAVTLDICGYAVLALKMYVIAQLIFIAVQFAIAQASAPVTLGASEAVLAGEVATSRMLLQRAATEAAQKIMDAVVNALKERAIKKIQDIAKEIATDIASKLGQEVVSQSLKTSFGAQKGIDFQGLGVAAGNGAIGKVFGEFEESDDGKGYDFKAKALGKVGAGGIAAAGGDAGGLRAMEQGAGELFNNFTEKRSTAGSGGEGGETAGDGTPSGGDSPSGNDSPGGSESPGGNATPSGSDAPSDNGTPSGDQAPSGDGTPSGQDAAATPEAPEASSSSAGYESADIAENKSVRAVFG